MDCNRCALVAVYSWSIAPLPEVARAISATTRTMASSDDGVEVESDEGVAPEVAAAEITGAQPLATADSPGKDNKEKEEGVEAAAAAEEQVEEIP